MIYFFFFAILSQISKASNIFYIDTINNDPNPSGSESNPFSNISIAIEAANNKSTELLILSSSMLQESQPIYFANNLSISKLPANDNSWLLCTNFFGFYITNSSFLKINGLNFIADQNCLASHLFKISENCNLEIKQAVINITDTLLFKTFFYLKNGNAFCEYCVFNAKNNSDNFDFIFHIEENSSLSIVNNFFEINSSKLSIILSKNHSEILISNSFLKNCIFSSALGVILTDYLLTFENVTIENLGLLRVSFIYFEKNFHDNIIIIIKNSSFKNIFQYQNSQNPLIFNSKSYNISLLIDSCKFEGNLAYDYFFYLDYSYSNVSMKNIVFIDNFALGILYFNYGVHALLENIIINSQNNRSNIQNNDSLLNYQSYAGTCFKLFNIIIKRINNLTITESFSNYTAIGFQIYDTFDEISKINENNLFEDPNTIINNSYFGKNYVFYERDQNSSGVFFIFSDFPILMANSYFYNNLLNSTSFPNYKIGAPCLNSFSYYNNLSIENSLFGFNQAKYFSNCLFFKGNVLNITNSYFFSNNPIYDILELEIFAQFYLTFTRKLESHVSSNGGAIYSQADYIFINNSIFFNNSDYRGGALFIESDNYQKSLYVQISKTLFSFNIAGTIGGGINFGLSTYLNGSIESCLFLQNDAKYGGAFASEYSDPENYVLIINCYFCFNTGEYAAGLLGHHMSGKLNVTHNIFYYNMALSIPDRISPIAGGSFGIWGGPDTIANFSYNKHIKNLADIHAGVCFIYGGDVTFLNENYLNNTVLVIGVVSIAFQSTLYMNNIIMENSFSLDKAGGIAINEYSYLYLNNVSIINSYSIEKGGAFLIYENSFVKAINLTVKNCFSNRGSVIMIYENYLNEVIFESSFFINNSATNSLIDSLFSVLSFNKCEFFQNRDSLMILETTRFFLNYSNIFNLSSTSGECFFISSMLCSLEIINTLVEEINSNSDNGFLISSYSNFSFLNLSLVNIFQKRSSIAVKNSIFNISNTSFLNNFPSAINSEISNCAIKLVKFEINSKSDTFFFSFINLVDNPFFEISNSSFYSAYSENEGGCINAIGQNLKEIKQFLMIINCNFTSSFSKKQGGSLYLLHSTVNLIGCYFENNIALNGGGSIYFEANSESSDNLFINETTFLNNTCGLGGGAIMWINKIPVIENVYFFENKANYGNNIASNIMRIKIQIFSYNKISNELQLEYDSFNNYSLNYTVKDQKAGDALNKTIIYYYLDYYNQTINTLNNELESFDILTELEYIDLTAKSKNKNELNNKSSDSLITYLLGENAFPIKYGKITPNNFKIFTKPDTTVYFILKSSILTKFSPYIIEPSFVELNISNSYNVIIKLEVSKCALGEIIKENSCFKCEYSEYSLNTEDLACKKCPSNAVCRGGAEIFVNTEYWRSSNLSDNIIYCHESKDVCLGGLNSECDDLFYGPLCRSCPKEHYNINNQYCLSCSDQIWNIFRVGGMMVILFIVIIVLIKSTFDNNKMFDKMKENQVNLDDYENKLLYLIDLQSFYIKVLVNWIQLTSLLYVMPLSWPDYFLNFLQFFSFFTSISTKFMAFECIYDENHYGEMKPYMKAISINIIPFILIIMTLIFWKIYQKIKKVVEIYDKIYASFIGIIIMMQQNILNECLNALTCIDIDGKLFLKNEPIYSCESDIHTYIKYFFLWPAFIIWGFILPLLILLYLFLYKKRLYEAKVFKKFNFFYIGYRLKYYFWDILILLRKSFCILIGLFVGLNFQLMILMLIMSVYFKYQRTCRPFLSKNLNFLESLAAFTGLSGIFLTLLINLLETFSEKIGFYAIVLIINASFLVIWTFFFFIYLVGVYRKIIQRKYPHLLEKIKSFLSKNKLFTISPLKMSENSAMLKKNSSNNGSFKDLKSKLSSLMMRGEAYKKKTKEGSLNNLKQT